MEKYQIITNGKVFRIQARCMNKEYMLMPSSFSSLDDAKRHKEALCCIEREEAEYRKNLWKVVPEIV